MSHGTTTDALDDATIADWRREHERVIADSQPGSYAEHISRQMLMTLGALDAARAELARVGALREAVAHVLVCHAAVIAAATPKRGGPDPMFIDVSTEQARLDDAVDELAALAQALERAAGSEEGE